MQSEKACDHNDHDTDDVKIHYSRRCMGHRVAEREQLVRHVDAERSGGLEVDHQLEPGRLRD